MPFRPDIKDIQSQNAQPEESRRQEFDEKPEQTPTTKQLADFHTQTLLDNVGDIQHGSVSASLAALDEVRSLQQSDYKPELVKNLQSLGSVSVVLGATGELRHLDFKGENGLSNVDIDVENQSVNGKTAGQLLAASIRQIKEFSASQLADSH